MRGQPARRWAKMLFGITATFGFITGATSAQDAAKTDVDPSGTWKWEREFRDTTVRNTLKLTKQDGDKLTGTLQTVFGNRGGDPVKIDNGKIDGNEITFSVTREFNDNEFTIDYKGKYANGELGGTFTLDFGNGPREIEWKAKRHIAAEDVVGKWSLSFEGPNERKIESSMTVKKQGEEKLAGTYHSSFFGDSPLKNVALKDGVLSWDVVFETNNGDFEVSYSGKPIGAAMKGTITSEFGGQRNETPFTAKLEKQQAAEKAEEPKVEENAESSAAAETTESDHGQKLYELRIYTTNEGKLPNLHARFRNHTMGLFEKHGMENIAYWNVSEGARGEDDVKDNLLVYIIAHKDKAAREASWKAFRNDPEWKKVASESEKDGPILAKRPRSILMTATDFSSEIKPNKGSDAAPRLFELRQYNVGPDRVPSTVDRFASGEKDLFTKHGMETVCFWTADDKSAFIYLLAHKDRDASRKSWQAFVPDFRQFMAKYRARQQESQRPAAKKGQRRGGGHEVRFLVPTDYSPLK